jgi:hypothetical protein
MTITPCTKKRGGGRSRGGRSSKSVLSRPERALAEAASLPGRLRANEEGKWKRTGEKGLAVGEEPQHRYNMKPEQDGVRNAEWGRCHRCRQVRRQQQGQKGEGG